MAVHGDQAATPERSPTPLLDRISSPAELKTLPLSKLPALAAEIRQGTYRVDAEELARKLLREFTD